MRSSAMCSTSPLVLASSGKVEIPKLAVMCMSSPLSERNFLLVSLCLSFLQKTTASSLLVSGRIITNSSPPYLAAEYPSSRLSAISFPILVKRLLPTKWPWVSLTCLKKSRSKKMIENLVLFFCDRTSSSSRTLCRCREL